MKLLYRSGVCALALVAGAAAMQFEPTVLRNLTLGTGTQQVSVGAVRTSLWSAAFAQNADSFTLDNVRFTWGSFTYEAKQVAFAGTSVPRGEIESLFRSGPEAFADRLARINVKSVTVPELKVTQKLGKNTQTILYRNVALNDIIAGRIAALTVEATAIEETGEKGPTVMSYGKTTVTDLDTPALVRLYDTKDASAPLTKIYGTFAIDKIDVNTRGGEGNVQIARINGRDIMARPTKDSWNGTLALIKELADKDTSSPEEQMRLIQSATDMLGAFDAGLIEATGISFKGGEDSKGTGSIARMAYTGAGASQPAETRVEGIAFADEEARLKIGSVSLTGFSLAPTLNGLKSLDGKALTELDRTDMRKLIPTLGTLRLTDMEIDAPESEDKPDERVKVSVGSMEITADKPLNGIPTNIRFEQRNVSTSLSPNSDDEFVRELHALGYHSIDGSFAFAASWNEANSEITIKEFSMDAKDMGSVRLTGLIGNVSADLFSPDEATASAAVIGAKAKSARIVVEDRGLMERYLARAAKEEGTTAEALQKMYAGATPLVLSTMIGNSEQSRTLGQAIARFIEKPGTLTIDAQPKNPSGFGVLDLMLASDPKVALEKLNITAKAE